MDTFHQQNRPPFVPESSSDSTVGSTMSIRTADKADALAVSSILAEAFPTLYTWTFGRMENEQIVRLLCLLYSADSLSLATTRLAERDGIIVGVAILHLEGSIGQGTLKTFWHTITPELGLCKGIRAFLGGMFANFAISSRIPTGNDLLYIEAIAVDEKYRGQGIGAALLTDAAAWGSARARVRMALHVLQRNTGARRLYERFGFRLTQPEPRPAPVGSRRQQWVSLLMMRDDISQSNPPSL